MGSDGLRFYLFLFLKLLIIKVNLAAFYKDLKLLCLDCRCNSEQLLSKELGNDFPIKNLEIRCEENQNRRLLSATGPNRNTQFFVEADTEVNPDREIQSVDFLLNDLNLTSSDILPHFTLTEVRPVYRKISLASNLIENIPEDFSLGLETLKILDLSKNKITQLDRETFKGLADLRDFNLSRNELSSVDLNVLEHSSFIEVVDLSQNKINKLHCEGLELKHLKKLDFSSNFLYGSSFCPNSVFPELLYLNLSRNQIDGISESIFASMPQLRVLDLSQNRLVSLRFEPLRSFATLEVLFLESNNIRNISGSIVSLRRLNLARNDIDKIDFVAVNLAQLNVSENRLTSLEPVLSISSKIKDLDVSWNYIKTVNCSQTYDSLKNLSLDGNHLVSHGLNFSGFHSLKSLSLSFIPTLDTFDTSSLATVFNGKGVDECTVLNISHNEQLKTITGTLADKNLCQIDLSSNRLRSLEQSMFNWDGLRSIDLQGNPLHCECSLKWMVDSLVPFLLKSYPHLLIDLSCETSKQYKDKRLVQWYKHNDFCNFSSDSRSFPAVADSFVTNEPRTEIKYASIISDNKILIAAILVAAIIAVMVAIGFVLMKKHTTKRRKEHMKRNRRYPGNKYGL